MGDDYSAVIVGGGHNGLICAAYLAKAGMDCLLLEARNEVGGCSSTVSALGGRFNVCNCDHILFRSTNIAEELELEKYGLNYLEVDPVNLALFWDERQPWFIHRGVEETIAELSRHYPDQVEGYRRYCREALPVVDLVVKMAGYTPKLRHGALALGQPKALRTLLKWQKMSALGVLEEFFSHPALITPALGLGPSVWGVDIRARGTGLGALSYAMRHSIGIGRPEGGSGALTSSLQKAFSGWGGTVRCNAKVEEITIRQKRVTGLRLESGEEISTGRVITAFDPRDVIVNLAKGAPKKFANKRRQNPQFDGYESKIDAIISSTPTYKNMDKNVGKSMTLPTAVITPGIEELVAGHLAANPTGSNGAMVPELPVMLANFPTSKDPSMCPDKNIMSLEVLGTPYALAGGWESSKEPERWLDIYSNLVDGDFLGEIEQWRCMTPMKYETEFNMPRGYAPSFTGSPLSAVLGRKNELTKYASEIKGLYFSGAGTYPGAGIWGAAGKNTATSVLQRH